MREECDQCCEVFQLNTLWGRARREVSSGGIFVIKQNTSATPKQDKEEISVASLTSNDDEVARPTRL